MMKAETFRALMPEDQEVALGYAMVMVAAAEYERQRGRGFVPRLNIGAGAISPHVSGFMIGGAALALAELAGAADKPLPISLVAQAAKTGGCVSYNGVWAAAL
jgi:hypothetical protein